MTAYEKAVSDFIEKADVHYPNIDDSLQGLLQYVTDDRTSFTYDNEEAGMCITFHDKDGTTHSSIHAHPHIVMYALMSTVISITQIPENIEVVKYMLMRGQNLGELITASVNDNITFLLEDSKEWETLCLSVK